MSGTDRHTIVVIDDDEALVRALQIALGARGYVVESAHSAKSGIEVVALCQPDVVILDLGLGDMSGLDVVRELRGWSKVAIIVLSASGDQVMKVTALDLGADDYLTKPFAMGELEARIRVAIRHGITRGVERSSESFVSDRLQINFPRRQVIFDGREIELTAKEFDLLGFLAKNVGKVCTHQTILREVWGMGYANELHYLRVYANRIRRKLDDPMGEVLHTNAGVGYQLLV